jgi:hypothetical protein
MYSYTPPWRASRGRACPTLHIYDKNSIGWRGRLSFVECLMPGTRRPTRAEGMNKWRAQSCYSLPGKLVYRAEHESKKIFIYTHRVGYIRSSLFIFIRRHFYRKHHPTEKIKSEFFPPPHFFFKCSGNIPFVRLFCFFYSPWPITAYLIRKILKAESHLSFGVFLLTYCNVQLAWLHTERWNTHLYPILVVKHRVGNVLEISLIPQTVHIYAISIANRGRPLLIAKRLNNPATIRNIISF